MRIRGMLLYTIACVLGCVDEDDAGDPCLEEAPSLEIGTGETVFEELNAGDPVVMWHGPQGGWHILGSARVANMGHIIDMDFTITDRPSGVVVSNNFYRVGLSMEGDCVGTYPGMFGYLNVMPLSQGEQDTPPELIAYHELDVKMTATNADGLSVDTQILAIAQPDPADL